MQRKFKAFRLKDELITRLLIVAVQQKKRPNRILEELIEIYLNSNEQAQTQKMSNDA